MKNIILLILSSFLSTTYLYSDNVLKQISSTDGLSNNSVNCIFEDSDNVIWIGTWDGLNAYDGRDIRTFRYNRNNAHSISNNIIRQIFEQNTNHLWVSTDYGINKWNKNTEEFERFFYGSESKKPKQENSYVLGISKDKTMYAYVKEQGWFYYKESINKFSPLKINIEGEVRSFLIDNEDNIYILLQNGEVHTSKIRKTNSVPAIIQPQKLDNLKNRAIEKMFFSDNKLLLYSKAEIVILNKLHHVVKEIKSETNKNVSHLLLQKDNVYASYYEGGCIEYNMATNAKTELTETSSKVSIFSLFFGSQDILWAGTDGQGVMMMYKYEPLFKTIEADYPVRSFCETAKGEIIVGTKGGGIKLLNKTNNTLSQYLGIESGLRSNSVYAMRKNKRGDIFIGTEGDGVNIHYANQRTVEHLSSSEKAPIFKAVYSIYFTNNDSVMWLGTSGYGLIKAELLEEKGKYRIGKTEQFVSTTKRHSIDNDVIYSISEGRSKNELWFGTRGTGLYKINTQTNQIDRIDENLLTSNDILCIKNTQTGLWVGTSYGLNKLFVDQGNALNTEYTDNQGLANNTIHGILEDTSQNIWVSTNLGLSFINIENNSILNYTFADGLQNNEFADGAFFIDQNNYLYFGGVDGFNYFKPENIKRRDFMPNLKLSSLKIYNTLQNVQQRIKNGMLKLSYDEQYLSLIFVTNDFINNENCEYFYRLSEKEWINNGNNPNIIFSNLSPGNYTLEVKYTNGDKVMSDNIYKLEIHVDNPWWFSNLALLIYAVLAAIIIYIVLSVVKNRIRLNRQILLEKIEKQHQQKVHEAKLDFFTNVAHEFFTPLTLIYGPAQHLLDASNLDSYSKRYIQIIKNNAERMQKLINELMDFRKAKSGHKAIYAEDINVTTLTDYISDNYKDISEQNGIDYEVNIDSNFVISSDRDFLEKILLNLISNAFKYTPNNGYIHMNVWQDKEDKSLRLRIRNSGKGLTNQQLDEIFNKYKIFDTPVLKDTVSTGIGLNLTKSLIELLGGTITTSSEYGEYVEFEIKIPPLKQNIEEEQLSSQNVVIQEANFSALNITAEKDVTILIVDDEKNIRELLKDILSPYYHILEAEDGRQALDMIEYSHPDIILSDVMMPNLDGISLINNLKSNPKTVHIPIISISAKTSIEDSIEVYKHGADLYIVKPFHPRHILSTVENLIRKQKQLKGYYHSGLSSVTLKDGIEMHKDDEKFMHDIATYIHNNINDETLNPGSVADFLGISKATLYRHFKEILDSTPSEFIRSIRLEHASRLLITTKFTVLEIMYKSGFNNKSYFYREFSKQYEMSPVEYRNKQTSN